jgi:hypothetical protein
LRFHKYKMQNHTPVTLDNWAQIQQSVLLKIPNDWCLQNSFAINPDIDQLVNLPEIQDALSKLNLSNRVVKVVLNVMLPNYKTNIHLDTPYGFIYSLNIPIVGCENSCIEFFTSNGSHKTGEIFDSISSRKHIYWPFDATNCTFTEEKDTSKPYILNATNPHRVVNKSDSVRIMLLLRLNLTNEEFKSFNWW